MRRIGLVLMLSAVVAGGSALAQQPPEEKKDRPPQKGDKVVVRGCVSGQLLTAAEFRQTDQTGKLTTTYTYGLQGPRDLLRALRADHERRLVDVEAILKSELPNDPALGTARIGGSRIKIGFGGPPARHTPGDAMPYHPVLEVISFEPVGSPCTPRATTRRRRCRIVAAMVIAASYRFGPFTVDGGAYRLLRNGEAVPLSPKIIDLLLYLAARPSALVSKEELFDALWPDVAVTDNALTQAVSELRQALGDNPSKPRYVQTVARRGYRFIAPVEPVVPPPVAPTPAADAPRVPVIAVLDFTNVSGDPEAAWLSSGIAETVTNDLRAHGRLRVIDRVRVVEAARAGGMGLEPLRQALRIDLAVTGSFQRAGSRLRITARVVDAASGEAVADAKADGEISDVFALQDRIVAQLGEAVSLSSGGEVAGRRSGRETSSLEAYRAFTEGRVRLEALDGSEVAAAITDFERAAALDPRYAVAHVGLANARFWQYEASRAHNQPDAALLAQAIDHVRRAIDLERDLAEAHATLAFLLVSAGRSAEALDAARRAVSLEPGYWGHHFRLAHAAWGEERLRALARVMEMYPDFPFAHFEAAMVYIARGALDRAESILREGVIVQDRQAHQRQRYPARGLHWLLGLVRLAREDAAEARDEFQREIDGGETQLYAREFTMNACDGLGFAHLAAGEPAAAVPMFRRALQLYPDHARSLAGLGAALSASGDRAAAGRAFAQAEAAIAGLHRGGRRGEASLAEAFLQSVRQDPESAIATLARVTEQPEMPFTGWTIPIEPLFAPLRARASFQPVLAALADRAR